MRRREFIAALGSVAAWPVVARAQQPAMPVIGYLSIQSSSPPLVTVPFFLQGLGEAGFVDGRNVAIDFRYGENQIDLLPRLAAELVARRVAVIVATGAGALAAKAAKSSIPIVFVIGDDPIKLGLVTSFGRREGNATGFNLMLNELAGKRLGLLRELVPNIRVFGVLLNPDSPEAAIEAKVVHALASDLGLEAIVLEARNENDVDAAFQTLGQRPASAVIIVPDPWARTRRFQLAELAGQRKLPDHLSATGFCRIGRSNQLWPKSNRRIPAIWSLHRPYSQGRKTRRSAGHAADEIRAHHQPQGRQGSRPRNSTATACQRRRGH